MTIYKNTGICALMLTAVLAFCSITEVRADIVSRRHREIHNKLQSSQIDELNYQALVDSITSVVGEDDDVFDPFPALDLYGEWSNEFVNPFAGKNVQIPDEKDINVSGFYPPTIGRITSPYGWRRRRMHRGTDIKLYVGDTVRAAYDGQVRVKKYNRRGYGYYYVIRHPNGLETVYGHLSKFLVDQDEHVKAGQPIALGGNTGRSTGSHLHFEMRFMGIDLNPASIIDFETFKPKENVYHFVHKKAKNISSGDPTGTGEAAFHKVKKGDTLGAIARKYGTSVSRLCKLNKIRANSILRLGQRIRYR